MLADQHAALRRYTRRSAVVIAAVGSFVFWTALWGVGLELDDFLPVLHRFNPEHHLCRRTVNAVTKTSEEVVKVCTEWIDADGRTHRLKGFELIERDGHVSAVPRGLNYRLLGLVAFVLTIMALGKKAHQRLIQRHRDRLGAR